MKMCSRLVLVTLLFTAHLSFAQSNDHLPPAIDWKQIELPTYTIRFPAEYEGEARRIAAFLSLNESSFGQSLEAETRPIVLILDNRGTVANGFVSPIPYHTRWYHYPPQDGLDGSLDWLTMLAIHEGRHVSQFSKFSQGASIHAAGVLYGPTGQAALSVLSFPPWWLEGDAVATETLMTESGRGRLPGWEAEFRAATLAGEEFPLRQLYNGSYVDKVPYLHKYGYLINASLLLEHGAETMEGVLGDAADWAIIPWSFNRTLRRETGDTIPEAYDRALEQRARQWLSYGVGPAPGAWDLLSPNPRVNTDYRKPFFEDDGSIIALRTGLAGVPALVRFAVKPDGNVSTEPTVIFEIAPTAYNYGYGGGVAAWSERRNHPRWGGQGVTVIQWLDLSSPRSSVQTIRGSESLASPAVSLDGGAVAAVEVRRDGNFSLVTYALEGGAETSRWDAPRGSFPRELAWTDRGSIVFVLKTADGLAIAEWAPGNEPETLVAPSPRAINAPQLTSNTLRYHGSYQGNQVLFARDLASGETVVEATSAAGVYSLAIRGDLAVAQMPALHGEALYFGSLGASAAFEPEPIERSYLETLFATEPNVVVEEINSIAADFEVTDAGGWGSVTGWGLTPQPGVFLAAESLLADWSYDLSFDLKIPTGGGAWALGTETSLIWQRWWPYISLGGLGVLPFDGSSYQAYATLGIGLPIDFSGGLWNRFVSVDTAALVPVSPGSSVIPAIDHQAGFGVSRRSALRDLGSSLGVEVYGGYGYTLDGSVNRLGLDGSVSLAGPLSHDLVLASAQFEMATPGATPFVGYLEVPRGANLGSGSVVTAQVDYHVPIAYPDIAIWDLSFVKRLRLGAFTDLSFNTNLEPLSISSGAEFWVDFTVLNLPADLSAGLRVAYDWESGGVRVEDTILGFGIDLR